MKKISIKLSLVVATILGIGSILVTNAARLWPSGVRRDNMNFISETFWLLNPTTGEVGQTLFGTNEDKKTAYTQNRSEYIEGECNSDNISVNYVNPSNFGSFSGPITGNQIFILGSGIYNVDSVIRLDGSCIGIIGFENVETSIFTRDFFPNTKNIIIDNIQDPKITYSGIQYTNTGNINIEIELNNIGTAVSGTIIGDIESPITGTLEDNNTNITNIQLTEGDGIKNIDISVESGSILLNHLNRKIVLDTTEPTFTAFTQKGSLVTSGGFYNTGVYFEFHDTNISGATLNGNEYTGSTVITEEGIYTFIVGDKAGNSTGLTFEIDYTTPTFIAKTQENQPIISGGIYNTGVWFTFADTNISGAKINGNQYTGGTTITGESNYTFVVSDKAGNSTGLVFTIDTTKPSCNTYSPISGTIVSGLSLNFSRTCIDTGVNISGYTLKLFNSSNTLIDSIEVSNTGNTFEYTGGTNIYNWRVDAIDKAGNIGSFPLQKVTYTKPVIVGIEIPGNEYQGKYYISGLNIAFNISGNQSFQYIFTGDTTTQNVFLYKNGTTNRAITLSGNEGFKNITMSYLTGTQSGSIGPISFYLDTSKPLISNTFPKPGRTNQTMINFQWSGSDKGAGIAEYILEVRNIKWPEFNIFYQGEGEEFEIPMQDGSYEWRVSAVDRAGNIETTNTESFSIDTTAPIIIGVTDNTYYNTDVIPIFNSGTGLLNGGSFASETPITLDGAYTLIVTNDIGTSTSVRFVIDKTAPTINTISPTSGETVDKTAVTFLRNGTDLNLSGYEFNLHGRYAGFFTGITMNGLGRSTTLSNIPNDEYIRIVSAIDKAGNRTTATGVTFNLAVTLTGTINLTGGTRVNDMFYTKGDIGVNIKANKAANVFVLSNDLVTNITSSILPETRETVWLTPTEIEGVKTFSIEVANNEGESFKITTSSYLDKSGPSVPGFSGQATNYSGASIIKWNAAIDTGVGIIDNYTYTILKGTGSVKTGASTGTEISIRDGEIGITGTYTIHVSAKDILGNTSETGSMTFIYTGSADTSPDAFTIAKEYDAELDEEYESEEVIVSGLSEGVTILAFVDEGSLIINGKAVGTTGYVKNGDKVQIAIYSSEEYDEISSGILNIGDKSSTFKVVTISEDNQDEEDDEENNDEETTYTISSLSKTQKLHISIIYNTLSSLYDGDDSQQEDFMLSFKYIVKDKIKEMEDDEEDEESMETLKYLYNLIDKNFEGDSTSSTLSNSKHTAPNGKEYSIKKVDGEYTSPNFIITKYFSSLNEIKEYIDKNNPKSVYVGGDFEIDQSRTSSPHKAPNGKIYTLFKTTDGKYGSNNFVSGKLFTDLKVMKKHIDVNNPK